jgi:hypothetical protein
MKNILIFFLFSLTTIMTQAQDRPIVVGTGGGITGAVTAFKITPGGEVFKGKGLVDIVYTECAGIKKSLARRLIKKVDELVKSSGGFNHPGNVYYFIGVSEDPAARITWGDPGKSPPPDVQETYTEIIAAVSKLRYKPLKKQDKKSL